VPHERRPYVRKAPGDRFGALVLIENLGKINGNGYWLARCDCGNHLRIQPGQLAKVRSCGKGVHHPRYSEAPSYQRVHTRLAEERGKASDAGPCVTCGRPAQEWSYDGTDPDHLHHEKGYPYSTDPSRYVPRCISCHRKRDRRDNIRPACGTCNSSTGGRTRSK